jgi:hypothetical protein
MIFINENQNSASPYARTPRKLKQQITTRKMVIQTATIERTNQRRDAERRGGLCIPLMSSRQYWMTRAAAVTSVGRVIA